ncbi:MAG TPA: hypothetical protein VIM58_00485 [Candidatus Methylacidiphilales bacterium]
MKLFAAIAMPVAWAIYGVGPALHHATLATALALALLAAAFVPRPKLAKPIDLATAFFFAVVLIGIDGLRLPWLAAVEKGLAPSLFALLAFGSLGVGRPFTVPYAKEVAPREAWGTPLFLIVNRILTACWGGAFVAMAALRFAPIRPEWIGALACGAILGAMLLLTKVFPDWYQARHDDDGNPK